MTNLDPHERVTRELGTDAERTLELREEELVAHKQLQAVGEVIVRTEVDEVPGHLEIEALREEVEIQHEPVGEFVSERGAPWEEDGVLIVPVYEEQLVVSKRLVLKERIRIRRIRTMDRRLFEETLRRERLVVEDPAGTGMVHERYPTRSDDSDSTPEVVRDDTHEQPEEHEQREQHEPGLVEQFVRRVLE
jgi:uncharacterized protein (TIGR02271 family)